MNQHTQAGTATRRSGKDALAQALRDSRKDTLATFAVYEAALERTGLAVPQSAQLNPPLWELGHIGWFQEYWLARNADHARAQHADPDAPRRASQRGNADALYDSGRVAHDTRWSLPLPDANATRDDLEAQLAGSLAMLGTLDGDDAALYFHRLVLLHEDMHHEAALYSAQALGLPISDARWQAQALTTPRVDIALDAGPWRLGHDGAGFAFDNELVAFEAMLDATRIDSRVVSWAEFLPFVDAGGYADARWWSDAGRAWLKQHGLQHPRYLRRDGAAWQRESFGQWLTLDMTLPACHLTLHEAQAWCAWAGRRLPSEAQWERAALTQPEAFDWGSVWEWTASDFVPYAGFVAHPYRDYSAPWFGARTVLRGASFLTQPRMHHARYRNFFTAERNDVAAGFRSCAA